MITRFLTILATLILFGFSISVLAAKPDKCSAWPECKGGGDQPTLYNVNHIGGDMGVYGTDWETSNNGWIEWSQVWPAGTGFVDLGFFLNSKDQGGPFTGARGANCFGLNQGIAPMVQGGFSKQNNGSALGWLWFDGRTDDGRKSVRYRLEIEGQFDVEANWPGSNSLNMMTWSLYVEGGGRHIRNISCTGTGVFDNPAVIDIVEKP